MNITKFSDYALRILIFLASQPEHKSTSDIIARNFDISFHHVAKAAQWLTRQNYIHAVRGRGGGLQLTRSAQHINIAEILRASEAYSGSPLVDCMRSDGGQCRLKKGCGLNVALRHAHDAFYIALSDFTLADIVKQSLALKQPFPSPL